MMGPLGARNTKRSSRLIPGDAHRLVGETVNASHSSGARATQSAQGSGSILPEGIRRTSQKGDLFNWVFRDQE